MLSRALRMFRKLSPQPVSEELPAAPQEDAPPQPIESPPTEQASVSEEAPGQPVVARSPQAQTLPKVQPLAVRRSIEPTTEVPEPAPSSEAEAPHSPPRQAGRPSEPSVTAPQVVSTPEARDTPQGREAARPAERPGGGALFTLRRVLRREPIASNAELTPAPARATRVQGTSTQRITRPPEPVESAPVASVQPEATPETGPEEAPLEQPRQDPEIELPTPGEPSQPAAIDVLPVEAAAPARRPKQGGLLFTLRRLFRPEPSPGDEIQAPTTRDAAQQAPTISRQPAAARPAAQPSEAETQTPAISPQLPGELRLARPQELPTVPMMASAPSEKPLALARPRTRTIASTESQAEGEDAVDGRPTFSRERRLDPAQVKYGGASTAIRRLPQRAEMIATKPSLVYLARKPAATTESTPEGMITYEVPREQLERRGTAATSDGSEAQSGTLARAMLPADSATANDISAGDVADQAAEATSGEEANEEIDLETLAKRVYNNIRNRLHIERERSGLSSEAVSR